MRDRPLILIVDDEPELLEIMSVKLRNVGYEPVVAHNAKEAVDAAGKVRPDLILMDIHMPGNTGTDAALEIKQNPATRNIKIVFLSNLKDPWPTTLSSKENVAKELGMEEYIDKSADLDVIGERVRAILGKQ